jgi:hypothetical protein
MSLNPTLVECAERQNNLPHFIGQVMGMVGLPAPEKSIPGFKLPIQTNCHTT